MNTYHEFLVVLLQDFLYKGSSFGVSLPLLMLLDLSLPGLLTELSRELFPLLEVLLYKYLFPMFLFDDAEDVQE